MEGQSVVTFCYKQLYDTDADLIKYLQQVI